MRKTLLSLLLLATACGTPAKLTSQQELADLQGTWSGSGSAISGGVYSGTAILTVNGSMGTLQLPSNCPATFNVPLTMSPGQNFAGSAFAAAGVPPSGGYGLAQLTGTVNSSSQLTITANFETPCLSSAVDVQFVLTKN